MPRPRSAEANRRPASLPPPFDPRIVAVPASDRRPAAPLIAPPAPPSREAPRNAPVPSATRQVTISNRLGLHARPAMMFVETASGFDAEVRVRRADHAESVDGKSIMQMMILAATQGTVIEITADGDDADAALDELVALVDSRFHEE